MMTNTSQYFISASGYTFQFLVILIFTSIATCAYSQVPILTEDFEDNTVMFTPSQPLFHDGVSDYFHIVPLNNAANPSIAFTGFLGSNYFAAEDIDDGGNRPAQGILSFSVPVSGYTGLTLDLLFAAGGNDGSPGYDDNDGFLVRASFDGGATQNLLAFEAIGATNQELRQDADFNGTGDPGGFLPTSTFTAFNNIAIAGTGTTLLIEVIFDSNDGNGEFAIDNLVIKGSAPSNAEIDVQRPASSSIVDGGSDNLGNNVIGAASYIYTIENTGSTDLTVSDVTATGATNISGFTATHTMGTAFTTNLVIPASSSANFQVDFNIGAIGAFDFDMDITSNDPDEANYDIDVSGIGVPPEVNVTVAPPSAAENSGTDLVYTFARTGDTTSPLTVNFSIGGSATFTTDYTMSGEASFTNPNGTITIPATMTSVDLTVSFVGDTDIELDETIIITVEPG